MLLFCPVWPEYQKRSWAQNLPHLSNVRSLHIADKNASDRQIAKAPAERVRRHFSSVHRARICVALFVEGKQISKGVWPPCWRERQQGVGDIAFVIGSSPRAGTTQKSRIGPCISMGRSLPFPTSVCLMLTEQLTGQA